MRIRTFTPWASQRRRRRSKGRAAVLVLLVLVMTLDVLEHVGRGIYTDHPRVCTQGLTRRPGSNDAFSKIGNDSHHHHCHYSNSSSIRSSIRSSSMEFTSNSSSLPAQPFLSFWGRSTSTFSNFFPSLTKPPNMEAMETPVRGGAGGGRVGVLGAGTIVSTLLAYMASSLTMLPVTTAV